MIASSALCQPAPGCLPAPPFAGGAFCRHQGVSKSDRDGHPPLCAKMPAHHCLASAAFAQCSAGGSPHSSDASTSVLLLAVLARMLDTRVRSHQPRHGAAAAAPTPRAAAEQRRAEPAPPLQPAKKIPYSWLQNWYPVGVVGDLPTDRPTPITIFGRKLILWREAAGGPAARWRCFSDACPHRMAPLSEGRIDSAGRLQCSLHGWSFDGDGRCVHVPQVCRLSRL